MEIILIKADPIIVLRLRFSKSSNCPNKVIKLSEHRGHFINIHLYVCAGVRVRVVYWLVFGEKRSLSGFFVGDAVFNFSYFHFHVKDYCVCVCVCAGAAGGRTRRSSKHEPPTGVVSSILCSRRNRNHKHERALTNT